MFEYAFKQIIKIKIRRFDVVFNYNENKEHEKEKK